MRESRVHFQWQKDLSSGFKVGVSLHSHTLHSRESMDFIHRVTKNTHWLSGAIRKQETKYRALKGRELDLRRAWWTPPLSARQAWELENRQIERVLDKEAMVSLTDHDTIDACLHLRVLEAMHDCPISVEWTVPFRETFFHIGVHNMPADEATSMMRAMKDFTSQPAEERIGPMLEWICRAPESLVVLNHPMWDENHIGEQGHRNAVTAFLDRFRPFFHALELNGLRPWKENQSSAGLARRHGLPVISGGDRHGREPNACVNLTNASSFAEFAAEVRTDGWSDVLFLPQYQESLRMRILDNMAGILEDDPNHAMGWVRWCDRVFYLTDEGIDKSLNELWGRNFPAVVNRFVGLMSLLKHRRIRYALRAVLNEKCEYAL